jgi:hypothetical protein
MVVNVKPAVTVSAGEAGGLAAAAVECTEPLHAGLSGIPELELVVAAVPELELVVAEGPVLEVAAPVPAVELCVAPPVPAPELGVAAPVPVLDDLAPPAP